MEERKMPELDDPTLEPLMNIALYGDRGNKVGMRLLISTAVESIQREAWNAALEAAAEAFEKADFEGSPLQNLLASAIRSLRKE